MTDALALVESPAQLLNVIELGRHESDLGDVRIAVLAPPEGPGRTQLRAMAALARDLGHEVVWFEPRLGGAAVARTVRALAGELGGVDRLVVGDPYSGVIGVIIAVSKAAEVTIVDDGTATCEFARQWASGEQLSRWHRRATRTQRQQIVAVARDQIAGNLRRRLSPVGCRLRLFSCLEVELAGVEVIGNGYHWTRAQHPTPVIKTTADLVGTSLVESGVVDADSYLRGVRELADRYGIDRYFAHRKESADKLGWIARFGLEVVQPPLPLELAARRGPIGRRVVSFPSTVVHTLPLVLAGSGAEVVVCDIPPGWYAPGTTRRSDIFLRDVSSSAQRRYGLASVAC